MARRWYDRRQRLVRDLPCGDLRVLLAVDVRRVRCAACGGVKQERLPWLAENPHYTRRFARYVGKLCRGSSLTEVAADLRLDWHAVKAMDMAYMQEQLERAGPPAPRVIGIDEISIRKGHVYRIIVSDLEVGRPIWFGGVDRSDASMAQFYTELGPTRCQAVEVAVMDMWRAFRTATERHAPQAAILYDKFHVLRQLGEAMDQVRKAEYKRLTDRDERQFIKGQKYVLLSHRANLSPEKRRALTTLLAANKRLHTAYVLKEQFGQLWEYRRVAWARKFFETWRRALRWQRLAPFEQFAALIERHWDGIAAYCEPDNKVALGFVEGLNNKVRVIQRRCYGIRDEQYLRLKVLTCTLPPLPREENG
ncbi:MAG: ISL3 family transposase [Gemmatimonas sp.]|nr:ISL3 family transposase [Gemmatimonas sp.]MCO4100697.1 ISL3 family transposase [Gemmatimonas sp.]MCO4101687.1 ISL3 family transposase [Gemmatimonas sp.]